MDSPIANAAAIGAIYGAIQSAWKVPAVDGRLSSRFNFSALAESSVKNSFHFAAMGLIYTIGTSAAATARNKEDHLNSGLGGAMVGAYT